jgi:hypothetical protein
MLALFYFVEILAATNRLRRMANIARPRVPIGFYSLDAEPRFVCG